MRPDARAQAAIEILDLVAQGMPAERALTNWARNCRFAGSGDRAAVRDITFEILRRRASFGWLGGGCTGRELVLGWCRAGHSNEDEVFSGKKFAPAKLTKPEKEGGDILEKAPLSVRLDWPDWLLHRVQSHYGDGAEDIFSALQHRAFVDLRVNSLKTTRDKAAIALRAEGIETFDVPLAKTALRVQSGARKVKASYAYRDGIVELQDAASQAVALQFADHVPHGCVLDFCAGGGGKSLALAASGLTIDAHDANETRLKDLPVRAARAGAKIKIVQKPKNQYDGVICDVPCSGSGAWRRQPDAKWAFSEDRLSALLQKQADILVQADAHVRRGGLLGYATCSLLAEENSTQALSFLEKNKNYRCVFERQWTPVDGADGFFLAIFKKS